MGKIAPEIDMRNMEVQSVDESWYSLYLAVGIPGTPIPEAIRGYVTGMQSQERALPEGISLQRHLGLWRGVGQVLGVPHGHDREPDHSKRAPLPSNAR